MAIFGFKKRKDEKLEQGAKAAKNTSEKGGEKASKKTGINTASKPQKVVASKIVAPVLSSGSDSNTASIIIRPRITEKSGVLSQSGVYTFEVAKNSNKASIAKAITALYKVVPTHIAIVNTPMKNVFVKGRHGTVAGIKKAIITVKKGEKIDFV